MPPSTPAAVIVAATTPQERIVVATCNHCRGSTAAGLAAPALIVVGGIVAMRAALAGEPDQRRHHRRAALGLGKTSVTIGILRALARRGLKVRGAKSGPDYIDPGFHTAATGLSGVNLDSWAMSLLCSTRWPATRPRYRLRLPRKRHGPVRRHSRCSRPHRLGSPTSPGLYGLPVLLVLMYRVSRPRRRPSPRASRPTIRMCAWPASSSTGWAASAIAGSAARPSKRSACLSSAPSCAIPR
jgi:hypothetical protein